MRRKKDGELKCSWKKFFLFFPLHSLPPNMLVSESVQRRATSSAHSSRRPRKGEKAAVFHSEENSQSVLVRPHGAELYSNLIRISHSCGIRVVGESVGWGRHFHFGSRERAGDAFLFSRRFDVCESMRMWAIHFNLDCAAVVVLFIWGKIKFFVLSYALRSSVVCRFYLMSATHTHACCQRIQIFWFFTVFGCFPHFSLSLYDWHFTILLQSIKERNIIRLISIFHCWDFYSCFFFASTTEPRKSQVEKCENLTISFVRAVCNPFHKSYWARVELVNFQPTMMNDDERESRREVQRSFCIVAVH